MSKRSSFLLFSAAGLLLAALPAVAQKAHKAKPNATPVETAIVENTGSTNTLGHRISITPSGKFSYVVPGRYADNRFSNIDGSLSNSLPKPMARRIFADLSDAMPLSALHARHGMRSASFGTKTYVIYKGQRSPDLTFASDARTVALKVDVDQIVKTLRLINAPRRPMVLHLNDLNTR